LPRRERGEGGNATEENPKILQQRAYRKAVFF
jgi:hypothetical protein